MGQEGAGESRRDFKGFGFEFDFCGATVTNRLAEKLPQSDFGPFTPATVLAENAAFFGSATAAQNCTCLDVALGLTALGVNKADLQVVWAEFSTLC
jgi:hypothetical protein